MKKGFLLLICFFADRVRYDSSRNCSGFYVERRKLILYRRTAAEHHNDGHNNSTPHDNHKNHYSHHESDNDRFRRKN